MALAQVNAPAVAIHLLSYSGIRNVMRAGD